MALKYIVVNLKYQTEGVDCACCKSPLAKMYTRDLETGLVYHNPWCFEAHVIKATKVIECLSDVTSAGNRLG